MKSCIYCSTLMHETSIICPNCNKIQNLNEPPAPTNRFCPYCGNEVNGDFFCSHCKNEQPIGYEFDKYRIMNQGDWVSVYLIIALYRLSSLIVPILAPVLLIIFIFYVGFNLFNKRSNIHKKNLLKFSIIISLISTAIYILNTILSYSSHQV